MPFADPERKRAYDRAYWAAHRDEINARRRVPRASVSASVRAARLRAQKRQWWREHRAARPVKVLVAP
jgi:hypothetical protein